VLCWHQVQSSEELKECLRKVKEAGLIPERDIRLCVVGDGARWIITRLFVGEMEEVINDLGKMKTRNEEVQSEIDSLLNYLKENKDRMNYKHARKGGYPIGSGGIESSNKTVCHTRLKRSGAWWYVEILFRNSTHGVSKFAHRTLDYIPSHYWQNSVKFK